MIFIILWHHLALYVLFTFPTLEKTITTCMSLWLQKMQSRPCVCWITVIVLFGFQWRCHLALCFFTIGWKRQECCISQHFAHVNFRADSLKNMKSLAMKKEMYHKLRYKETLSVRRITIGFTAFVDSAKHAQMSPLTHMLAMYRVLFLLIHRSSRVP